MLNLGGLFMVRVKSKFSDLLESQIPERARMGIHKTFYLLPKNKDLDNDVLNNVE